MSTEGAFQQKVHVNRRCIPTEGACQQKKRDELGLKYKHAYWLMGRRPALSTQEAGALQTDIEAYVDLRHTTMGVHKTERHSHNTEISKQSSQE